MGRNPNRDLVIVAQLTGVAAGFGQVKRCTESEALAEIAEVLASAGVGRGSARAVELLSLAAAGYVQPRGPGDEFWPPRHSPFVGSAPASRA